MRALSDKPAPNIQADGGNHGHNDGRRRVVRRVARSSEGDGHANRLSGPRKPDENVVIASKEVIPIKCIQCGAEVPKDSMRCPNCGATYIEENVPELTEEEEEFLFGNEIDDPKPLFEEDNLGCGYFDVDCGIVAYIEPRHAGNDSIYECHNCRTILEFEAKRCPLCGGSLEKVEDGIVEIVNGIIVGDDLDLEISRDVFCPVCGDLLALENGRCIVCGTQLLSIVCEDTDYICPVVSSDCLVFVHLNVEDGEFNYLMKGKDQECMEAGSGLLPAPPDDEINLDGGPGM